MGKNQSGDIPPFKLFENKESDKDYWNWMDKNPEGYVIKDRENIKGAYIYHKSGCNHIADKTLKLDRTLKWSHVGSPKICAVTIGGIEAWFVTQDIPIQKMVACKHCLKNLSKETLAKPIVKPVTHIMKETAENLPMLGKIDVKIKTGKEQLTFKNEPLNFSLFDFWQWSVSDIVSNATRGLLAEFIVATAVGVNIGTPRKEWAAYDLDTPEGIKLEIKSSAYLQTWKQDSLSKPLFGIKATRSYNYESNKSSETASRDANVYVFCLLNHKQKSTVNPLDMNQWEFYVLATKKLNDYKRSQDSITLKSLRTLTDSILYNELYEKIRMEYHYDQNKS
jgi:hypothetical protein